MELRQVKYFLTIVDLGSFSAAAEELFISQSSLSKQIITLEKELGVQLFDRSKRKVHLTDAGEAFLEYAHRFTLTYTEMLSGLDEFKLQRESFSITAIPVIAQYGITSYIANFKEAYPDIHFTLEEREGLMIGPALLDHQFDLGFLRNNYIDLDLFSYLEINKDKLLVVTSNKHRLSHRTSIAMAELANENFIMFDKGTILHELSVDACRKAAFEPRIFYASIHLESIFGLVSANIGVALMMGQLFKYYKNPGIVAIPLEELIESNIVLAYPKHNKLPKGATIFFNYLLKTFADHNE